MKKYQELKIELLVIHEDVVTMSIPEDLGGWPSGWGGVTEEEETP